MPKDKALIERIRPILSKRKGFSEKRMFGGVCFILNGNMYRDLAGVAHRAPR